MDTISSAAAAVRPPPGLPGRTPCPSTSEAPQAPQLEVFSVVLRKAARGMLGVSVAAVRVCGLSAAAGLMVTEIQAGGAADEHNHTFPSAKPIRLGDVIVGVNGVQLSANLMHRVLAEVATSMSEQLVEVSFLRQPLKLVAGAATRSSRTTLAMSPSGKQDASAFQPMASSQASTSISDLSCDSPPQTASWCSSADNLPDLAANDKSQKKKNKKKRSQGNEAKAEAKAEAPITTDLAQENFTTIMLKQLPGFFSRAQLEALLDQEGFAGLYDFAYVPKNLKTQRIFGYAFVNLVDGDVAVACKDALDGYAFESDAAGQVCNMATVWAHSQQGLQANVLRYRDSPLMHESVPDESKPALFYRGVRVDFPPPAKALVAPPQKRRQMFPPEVQDVPRTCLR
jgi:hypothetical protein